jgi:hypothetical protein
MTKQDMDKLIGDLCAGLSPVKPLHHPLLRVLLYMFLTVAYVGVTVHLYGLRMDWADKLHDLYFVFETLLALSIWVTAILSAAWLCVPDMRGQGWMKVVPVTLAVVMLVWTFLRATFEGIALFPIHWVHCFKDGCVMGFIPFVLVVLMARRGATCRPYWMAAMNALSVTMAGWVGLRLTCSMNDMGHGFIYHFIPYMVFGVIIGLLARRLFRW